MNHSICSADRMTHLKIVVIALVAATAVASIATCSHIGSGATLITVARASKPMTTTSSNFPLIR